MPERAALKRLYLEFVLFCTAGGLLLLLSAVVWLWYLWSREAPTVRYLNLPFPMLSPTQEPGHVARFHVMRCVDTDEPRPFLTTLTLVNADTGQGTKIAATGAELLPGCSEDDSGLTTIPNDMPSGRYYIQGITVAPGRLRFRYVRWRTEDFRVVGKQ